LQLNNTAQKLYGFHKGDKKKKKIEIKPYLCEKLDLFSLGVVMYFLLFNRHPYEYKVNIIII